MKRKFKKCKVNVKDIKKYQISSHGKKGVEAFSFIKFLKDLGI